MRFCKTHQLWTPLGAPQHLSVLMAQKSCMNCSPPMNPAFPKFLKHEILFFFCLIPSPRPPGNTFCRTSTNFGIACTHPILGKVFLLEDPSADCGLCGMDSQTGRCHPQSRGRLGRAQSKTPWVVSGAGWACVVSVSKLFFFLTHRDLSQDKSAMPTSVLIILCLWVTYCVLYLFLWCLSWHF